MILAVGAAEKPSHLLTRVFLRRTSILRTKTGRAGGLMRKIHLFRLWFSELKCAILDLPWILPLSPLKKRSCCTGWNSSAPGTSLS